MPCLSSFICRQDYMYGESSIYGSTRHACIVAEASYPIGKEEGASLCTNCQVQCMILFEMRAMVNW